MTTPVTAEHGPVTTPPTSTAPKPQTGNVSGHEWMSGSSGVGAANGQFGSWRGSNLDIVSSWAGNADNSANFYTLWKGAEYGSWNGSMDMSVGGIDPGETWAQAASGKFDARWAASLTKLKQLWGGRDGTMYIRFAHEMNGYWFSWSVNKNNYQDFMTSWKRYRALQQQIFPEAELVFSVNKETNGAGMDWTKFFPGKQYVDVLSVDYYNNWPYASTLAQFQQQSWDKDGYGAPRASTPTSPSPRARACRWRSRSGPATPTTVTRPRTSRACTTSSRPTPGPAPVSSCTRCSST